MLLMGKKETREELKGRVEVSLSFLGSWEDRRRRRSSSSPLKEKIEKKRKKEGHFRPSLLKFR